MQDGAGPGPTTSAAADERSAFASRLREVTARVVARAREPFELDAPPAPTPQVAALALRHAIRLAAAEAEVAPAQRPVLSARIEAAVAPRMAGDGAALDAALAAAVTAVLAESGIEARWREAAAWQDAWEATERRPAVLPRGARWLIRLWPIAAGIATGAAVGALAALVYYTVIAPPLLH